jgi:resolvase-like protein
VARGSGDQQRATVSSGAEGRTHSARSAVNLQRGTAMTRKLSVVAAMHSGRPGRDPSSASRRRSISATSRRGAGFPPAVGRRGYRPAGLRRGCPAPATSDASVHRPVDLAPTEAARQTRQWFTFLRHVQPARTRAKDVQLLIRPSHRCVVARLEHGIHGVAHGRGNAHSVFRFSDTPGLSDVHQRSGWVFCDLPPGPSGKFVIAIMAAVAELQAGLISERTKAALSQAKARGSGSAIRDFRPARAQLAAALNARGVRTARGGPWRASRGCWNEANAAP